MHKSVLVSYILFVIFIIWWCGRHCELRSTLRNLWSEHVWWTREYIINSQNIVTDSYPLSRTTSIAARLMQNQEHIGTALGNYFGVEFGNAATVLLKEHIEIAAALLNGQSNKLAAWYTNAEQISSALASVMGNGKYWSHMMKMHLDLTLVEVEQLKNGNAENIKTFEQILAEALDMGDAMASYISWRPWKFIL